jgi:hypothetical protein
VLLILITGNERVGKESADEKIWDNTRWSLLALGNKGDRVL